VCIELYVKITIDFKGDGIGSRSACSMHLLLANRLNMSRLGLQGQYWKGWLACTPKIMQGDFENVCPVELRI